MKIMIDGYLTIKQASSILGVSPLTLRNWDKSGKLKASRHPINNYRVYKVEDIEAVIQEIKVGSGFRKTSPRVFKRVIVKHLTDEQ